MSISYAYKLYVTTLSLGPKQLQLSNWSNGDRLTTVIVFISQR